MRAHRFGGAAVALAMFVSACGGGQPSAAPATTSPTTDTTVLQGEPAAETTLPRATQAGDDATTSTGARPAPDPDRELAPDFTLALADGSTFVLSEEARPVFMVFWAEW